MTNTFFAYQKARYSVLLYLLNSVQTEQKLLSCVILYTIDTGRTFIRTYSYVASETQLALELVL